METTDNQILKFRVATFIALIFGVASLSFTISGIISEIGAQADRIEEEKYARRTNDNELQEQIDELKTIIKDLSSNKRK
jgi:hypothetical protein